VKRLIRVLIVEDSVTVRTHLSLLLRASSVFQVVGHAGNADEAVAAAARLSPDVVSLDVFLPGASAAEVTRRILAIAPVPIVLVSSAPRDTREVFDAISAGALDFVRKPAPGDKVATAALVRAFKTLSAVSPATGKRSLCRNRIDLVVVGSSTGGPEALMRLLQGLGGALPVPMVVAQHIAAGFEEGLARWLSERTGHTVKAATSAQSVLVPGEIVLGRAGYDVQISPGPHLFQSPAPPQGYHPSVDVLFSSASGVLGGRVAAIVLTGVGSDGRAGAKGVSEAGGLVMAQDKESSTVYGMPAAVTRLGLASVVGTPEVLAHALVGALRTA